MHPRWGWLNLDPLCTFTCRCILKYYDRPCWLTAWPVNKILKSSISNEGWQMYCYCDNTMSNVMLLWQYYMTTVLAPCQDAPTRLCCCITHSSMDLIYKSAKYQMYVCYSLAQRQTRLRWLYRYKIANMVHLICIRMVQPIEPAHIHSRPFTSTAI